jgi:hypothetical protein
MTEKPERTIIIGDVHGCLDELQDLLRVIKVRPSDRLVSVGDLIGKGPDSRGALEWAMAAPNLRCVLGNHEARFLEAWRAGRVPSQKPYDQATVDSLGADFDRCMRFVSRWPLLIDEGSWMAVHAGIDPELPLLAQDAGDLTTIRRLSDGKTPWYERYQDPRLIVFGHWVRRAAIVRPNAIGLDTGCVYGGVLTALILPERRLVSVPARRVYFPRERWE